MEDVTLNDGTVMTDAQFVEERGMGDKLTDFVATKEDLALLAHKLVAQLLSDEFICLLQSSRSDKNRRDYTTYRLDRVMEFLPELEVEIQEKLCVGREQNLAAKARYGLGCRTPFEVDCKCPHCTAEGAEVHEIQMTVESAKPQETKR